MQEAIAAESRVKYGWLSSIGSLTRAEAPSRVEWCAVLLSVVLLVLSFPDFSLPAFAWVGLIPLLTVLARRPSPWTGFVLGWVAGFLFFYCTCYWLTYSMIHYGGLPGILAYLLLIPGALVVGLFIGLFALTVSIATRRWGPKAILLAPIFWVSFEWLRLVITGQLWNALGYSQAEVFNGLLLGPARFGGVYAISFLLLVCNCTIAFALVSRRLKTTAIALVIITLVPLALWLTHMGINANPEPKPYLDVVAVQPNVPMTLEKTTQDNEELVQRHLQMSTTGLNRFTNESIPRLVVWPESPMNFSYANDRSLRQLVATFTRENNTSLIINSLEPAPAGGAYNSALLINEEGRLIAQYDKIRLMPFGEYVPIPQWLGGSLISGIVGDFTPGTRYALMRTGTKQVGTFICIESAYPSVARRLTSEGADLLINISNDGYLGPTAVMHQHLANAILRAVENGRPLLRVTNTGISAFVQPDGKVTDRTSAFKPEVRTWQVSGALTNTTFYTKHGDLFVKLCSIATLVFVVGSVYRRRSIQTTK